MKSSVTTSTQNESQALDFSPGEARPAPVRANPINETFRDITPFKLFVSSLRVFMRIYRLQGLRSAVRVFPIVWMIIVAVRGFARYHSGEFERTRNESINGGDVEEAVLTSEQYEEYRRLGNWLCRKLHALGPTFIKIGQTLSTRADLLPLPAMLELAKLQEDALPFPTEVARQVITRELGAPPETLYATFDEVPIAAASLSQAYHAYLKDGRQVVVKVQRPDLSNIIARDVQVLGAVADEVMRYPRLCRHTNWPGVVEEFARTTFEEIDY
ncbi:MAG TPA: AarF/UbiB family protein, partial [Candidatus Obscuribacterales bacterium]